MGRDELSKLITDRQKTWSELLLQRPQSSSSSKDDNFDAMSNWIQNVLHVRDLSDLGIDGPSSITNYVASSAASGTNITGSSSSSSNSSIGNTHIIVDNKSNNIYGGDNYSNNNTSAAKRKMDTTSSND